MFWSNIAEVGLAFSLKTIAHLKWLHKQSFYSRCPQMGFVPRISCTVSQLLCVDSYHLRICVVQTTFGMLKLCRCAEKWQFPRVLPLMSASPAILCLQKDGRQWRPQPGQWRPQPGFQVCSSNSLNSDKFLYLYAIIYLIRLTFYRVPTRGLS